MSIASIYVSLTGLMSFSKGLDVVSDNVANLNTPGFKATEVFFQSLAPSLEAGGGAESPGSLVGFGSFVGPRGRRLISGEIRSTGVVGNLAIDGNGFFVLRTPEGLTYTRSGQFQIQPSGLLVDPKTGGVVQAFSGGSLTDLRIDLNRTSAAVPTTKVTLRGVLSTDVPTSQVQTVSVVDADGTARTLSLDFTRIDDAGVDRRAWNVSVKEGTTEIATGRVEFNLAGTPVATLNTVVFDLEAASGESRSVTLDFGAPGSSGGVLSQPGGATSTVTVADTDGRALGTLAEFSVGTDGAVTYRFNNGETESGLQVALANTPDPTQLTSADGTYFIVPDGTQLPVGRPGTSGFGTIVQSSIELANVELSREFADIVILQRGYQASSQVLNVSSQIVEDLYNKLSSGR